MLKTQFEVNFLSSVNHFLEDNQSQQIVILCDLNISPRELKPQLRSRREILLYDSGVSEFRDVYTPHYYNADTDRQREDLLHWLEKGGVLLTHDKLFKGCEAETVVFVSPSWGSTGSVQRRGGAVRAVSDLCLVTSSWILSSYGLKSEKYDKKRDEIKQYFHLINVLDDTSGNISFTRENVDYFSQYESKYSQYKSKYSDEA